MMWTHARRLVSTCNFASLSCQGTCWGSNSWEAHSILWCSEVLDLQTRIACHIQYSQVLCNCNHKTSEYAFMKISHFLPHGDTTHLSIETALWRVSMTQCPPVEQAGAIYLARLARCLHPAGETHGSPEHGVVRELLANHPGDHLTAVHTNLNLRVHGRKETFSA